MMPEVLICDDDPGVRASLTLVLERDFTLASATNGEEALAYLQTHAPAAMILDVKMPKMDGLETLRQLHQRHPALPVLVLSSYESSEIAAETIQLGARDFLGKPFDRHVLLAKVRALAAGH